MILDPELEARRIAAVATDVELHQELGYHEHMSALLVAEIRRRQARTKGDE